MPQLPPDELRKRLVQTLSALNNFTHIHSRWMFHEHRFEHIWGKMEETGSLLVTLQHMLEIATEATPKL